MTHAYTGGCACGAIRYEIATEPVFQNHCQCRDCQRKSGTGHGSYLTFARAGVKHSGNATLWDIAGDSGNIKTRAFCPACGSPVYMTSSRCTRRAWMIRGGTSRRRSRMPCGGTSGIFWIRGW